MKKYRRFFTEQLVFSRSRMISSNLNASLAFIRSHDYECIYVGSDTVLVQIASEATGVSLGEIRLVRADTATTTDAGATSASRQTYVSGNAILNAIKSLKREAIKEAGALSEKRLPQARSWSWMNS
jgi:CO/xanthine dehydrogenase Mo-binding subunit